MAAGPRERVTGPGVQVDSSVAPNSGDGHSHLRGRPIGVRRAGVCARHAQQITAGQPWRTDYEQRVLLMGADVAAPEEYVFNGISIGQARHNLASEAEPLFQVELRLQRRVARGDTDDERTVSMFVSRQRLRKIGEDLLKFAR